VSECLSSGKKTGICRNRRKEMVVVRANQAWGGWKLEMALGFSGLDTCGCEK